MKQKTISELFNEFKNMSLGKQSLISLATITLIITVLSNYKSIKKGTTDCISAFTKDENVKEFMEDVNKVINSLKNLIQNFFKNDKIEPDKEPEKEQIND